MAARDNQRKRVYSWEGGAFPREYGIRFKTFEEVTEFANMVWEYWRPGTTPPQVRNGGTGNVKATGSRQYIRMPRWSWSPEPIFHELAHAMNDKCQSFRYRKNDSCAAHGPEFVRIFCDLTEWWTGKNIVSSAYAAKIKVAPKLSWAKPQKKRSARMIAQVKEYAAQELVRLEIEDNRIWTNTRHGKPVRYVADPESSSGVRAIVLNKKGEPDKRYRQIR
jgi:hypothetical protein